MLEGIVSYGKTVDEAVRKAAEQLKISTEEIDYEVVDSGYRSFFFYRPVVIQARIRESKIHSEQRYQDKVDRQSFSVQELDPAEANKENHAVDNEGTSVSRMYTPIPAKGTAWVKDGKVFCKNGEHQYALVTPCKGVTMTINGQVVTGTSIITEDDVIEIQIEKEMVDSEYTLTISDDKMQVLMEYVPGYCIVRELDDLPPSRDLVLSVTETKLVKPDLKELQVLEELKQLGVKFGVNYDEILSVCQSQEPVKSVVARGVEPIPGLDGGFEFFQTKRKQQKDQFTLSEKTDWKERFSLPTVHAGEVIGRPIPAKPGTPGKNVFGEVVPAPEVKEITILASEGTTLHGVDQKVVATSSGRVKVDERSNNTLCFSILPQYVHNGNVNFQSGNIRFRGDVYIIGHVEDGMTVEAGGNLHIAGRVSNAIVRTGGDAVITGSVVGSTIICGYSNLIWDKILPSFKAIRDDLILVIRAIKQLESNRSFSKSDLGKGGLQPLLRLLAENKFQDLPVRIREICSKVKSNKNGFDADTLKIMDFLEKAFLYYHPLVTKLEQLDSLVIYMDHVISAVEYDSNKKMNIQVQSLTNSSIMSAWNVKIDRFSYGSDIYCKGGLQVNETIRGGSIRSGEYVMAGEIGSSRGSHTEVDVMSSDGFIKADVVWADTILKVGGVATKLKDQEDRLHVRLNGKRELILR
ncbi:flagellar assembly protein A [Effusibacillus dendaii]|uniref:Polymerase n=1 Tax=Effusibacillus dendaii TaxID=2743772 RepID=A0A7I8D4H8_9BACL|nr:FapA family protein [Effusibacillus dendaii]BCJ85023.1 polymerase [Effusibacillus dendaii]